MSSNLRSGLVLVLAVALSVGITTLPIRAADDSKALQDRVNKLERKIKKLEAKLQYVKVVDETINGLVGPHVIFEGCNVHVRDGSGHTFNEEKVSGDSAAKALPVPQKLGNLIIGYNEEPSTEGPGREGSHNLIVGRGHSYSQVGCVVFGEENTVSGIASSVTAGLLNKATSDYTSVCGGRQNEASNVAATVGGGSENTASGNFSNVSGGYLNTAFGSSSSVSGGDTNIAFGSTASVSGGSHNAANGTSSSVSGGYSNAPTGSYASVSGGFSGAANNIYDWAAGSLFEDD